MLNVKKLLSKIVKNIKKERYITFLDFFVLDGIETLRFGIHCDCMKLMVANLRVFCLFLC